MNLFKSKMLKVLNDSTTTPSFKASSPQKVSVRRGNSFSLPAGKEFTCIGETEACEGCYAQKGRHHFKNVQVAFAGNYLYMKEFEKNNDLQGCVMALHKIIPTRGIFRIHESGDFENQFAIDVWDKVIKHNPNTMFYAYTRSFTLDFSKVIKNENFTLWASSDPYNKSLANKFAKKYGLRKAYGPYSHDEKIPVNSFVCPTTNKKIPIKGACEKCRLCIDSKTRKNVVFLAH